MEFAKLIIFFLISNNYILFIFLESLAHLNANIAFANSWNVVFPFKLLFKQMQFKIQIYFRFP